MAVPAQYPGYRYFRILSLTAFVFLSAANGLSEAKTTIYVLRLVHETSAGTTCVLVDETGAFHFESGDRERTTVFEGGISAAQLNALRQNVERLSEVSQDDIEEPLIPSSRDLLDIHIFQKEGAKELLFRSAESQRLQAPKLSPLLGWMYRLRRLPHREISEDAGKRNCLPRGRVVLKARDQLARQPAPMRTPISGRRLAAPARDTAPSRPPAPPVVRLELTERTSSAARQMCALVADDGLYRFERRFQKNGSKKVENSLAKGRITTDEMNRLRKILESPTLVGIAHRKPPPGMPLINGAVLELSIQRGSGVQDLVLTDSTHRNTFFYSGDADITRAAPLLGFVGKQIEPRSVPTEKVSELNGCGQLP